MPINLTRSHRKFPLVNNFQHMLLHLVPPPPSTSEVKFYETAKFVSSMDISIGSITTYKTNVDAGHKPL